MQIFILHPSSALDTRTYQVPMIPEQRPQVYPAQAVPSHSVESYIIPCSSCQRTPPHTSLRHSAKASPRCTMSIFQMLLGLLPGAAPRSHLTQTLQCLPGREIHARGLPCKFCSARLIEVPPSPTSIAFADIATVSSPFEHADRAYGLSIMIARAIGFPARFGFLSRLFRSYSANGTSKFVTIFRLLLRLTDDLFRTHQE